MGSMRRRAITIGKEAVTDSAHNKIAPPEVSVDDCAHSSVPYIRL